MSSGCVQARPSFLPKRARRFGRAMIESDMSRKAALLGVLCCITPSMLHAQAREAAGRAASNADPAAVETEVDELTVTAGQKPRGSVVGDIPPEASFSAGDVRALGVSSVNELLEELAPQTASGRGGAPVVLLNGRRISGMGETRDIPTEAIARVEVLPEEVALKYGYTAEQKVVNIVLRQRFRAKTGEAGLSAPTAGGQASEQLEASDFRINRDGRFNFALRYQHSDALLESDRNLVSNDAGGPYGLTGNVTSATPGGEIDPALGALVGRPVTVSGVPAQATQGAATLADFASLGGAQDSGDVQDQRSLLPRTQQLSVNAVFSKPLTDKFSGTLNLSGTLSDSTALLGPARTLLTIPTGDPFSPFADDVALYRYRGDLGALEQNTRSGTGHLGFTVNGEVSSWRLSVTGNYDHGVTRTLTDRGVDATGLQAQLDALDPTFNPFGPLPFASFVTDRPRSVSDTGNIDLLLNGTLLHLPAGDISASVKLGSEGARLASETRRAGVEASDDLWRGTNKAQFNLDVPIAKRAAGVLPALGNLSANLNVALNSLSDFGELTTLGYGVTWSPIQPLSLVVSMTGQEGAPTMQQLGGPVIATPDARVFDFVRGETVDVTRLTGGNPNLAAEDRRVFKAQVTLKPPQVNGLTFVGTYLRTRIDDPIAAFPAATAEIEAAFPDRFVRDADGTLLRVDARPVNFARQESDQIRWGLNFSRQIGRPPPRTDRRAAQGGPGEGPPGAELLPGGPPPGERPPGAEPRMAGQTPEPGAAPAQGGPGFGGGFGGGRGPGGFGGGGFGPGGLGRGGGPGATRIQFAVYHTIHLREQVLIRDGLAPLDLLDGAALNAAGGQPEHEVEVQAGVTRRGLGARLSGNWRSATRVNAGASGAASDLRFSDLATVDLRLFANLAAQREWVAKYPVLRGMRVTLVVTNLFDAKMSVKDATGLTPINYQPDYLDALGRSVKVSVRKIFF